VVCEKAERKPRITSVSTRVEIALVAAERLKIQPWRDTFVASRAGMNGLTPTTRTHGNAPTPRLIEETPR